MPALITRPSVTSRRDGQSETGERGMEEIREREREREREGEREREERVTGIKKQMYDTYIQFLHAKSLCI